jgi:hypothetical protein
MNRVIGGQRLIDRAISLGMEGIVNCVIGSPLPFEDSVAVRLCRNLRIEDIGVPVIVKRLAATPAANADTHIRHRIPLKINEFNKQKIPLAQFKIFCSV